MIKAVIFDKDGTLIELGHTWDEPTVKMMEELLSLTDLTDEEKLEAGHRMGLNEAGTGIVPNSIFAAGSILDQAQALSQYIDLPVDEIEDRIEDAYYRYLKEKEIQAHLTPGTEALLTALSKDYILAIVTNDNYKLTLASLEKLNILQYFDFVGCADQYGPKPHPKALHEIARRFNITLDQMVYVGDSELDMEYGQFTRAGIGYAENDQVLAHLGQAEFIVRDLAEVETILNQLNKEEA